jgi:diguanylate cyclase (GGDEF)-like protein
VTKEIAHALDHLLRDYDLAGRFGGEEFSLLLPQTRAVDAFRIARRVQVKMISTTRGSASSAVQRAQTAVLMAARRAAGPICRALAASRALDQEVQNS